MDTLFDFIGRFDGTLISLLISFLFAVLFLSKRRLATKAFSWTVCLLFIDASIALTTGAHIVKPTILDAIRTGAFLLFGISVFNAFYKHTPDTEDHYFLMACIACCIREEPKPLPKKKTKNTTSPKPQEKTDPKPTDNSAANNTATSNTQKSTARIGDVYTRTPTHTSRAHSYNVDGNSSEDETDNKSTRSTGRSSSGISQSTGNWNAQFDDLANDAKRASNNSSIYGRTGQTAGESFSIGNGNSSILVTPSGSGSFSGSDGSTWRSTNGQDFQKVSHGVTASDYYGWSYGSSRSHGGGSYSSSDSSDSSDSSSGGSRGRGPSGGGQSSIPSDYEPWNTRYVWDD